MRKGILTSLLILLLCTVQAQYVPDRSYSRQDTVQAIQRLFGAKRATGSVYGRGAIYTSLTGALAGFLSSAAVSVITLGKTKQQIVPYTLAGSGLGLVPAGIGLAKKLRFSRKWEDNLLTAYQNGSPLPPRIRRRLKARFFR